MRIFVMLVALLLTGCDYALRIPYPKVERLDNGRRFQEGLASSSLQPTSPAFGETVTLTLRGLRSDHYHSLYLTYGYGGGGDPDRPSKDLGASYFKLGNLAPVDEVATISFELRPHMGNDQNGEPFKLSNGQLVTFGVKSQNKEKPTLTSLLSGFSTFLIK